MNNRNRIEIADIFRRHGPEYRKRQRLSTEKLRVMGHIERCRTEALGGHVEACNACGAKEISYNSCRDRHCPKCQTLAKERWLTARKAELLPCGYFHLVFTLPHALNSLVLDNMAIMLGIFFTAVNETLQGFARNPSWRLNGRIGCIAVLHTWNQLILDHFHLHCLVPAGALALDRSHWTKARRKFLFRTDSLAKAFRNRYLDKLEKLHSQGKLKLAGENADRFANPEAFKSFLDQLRGRTWVAYAKAPFAGPEQVLEYLGRYTHRVAISNDRIKGMDEHTITFSYRDRRQSGEARREMILAASEFIRRFLLHTLPSRFMKIRYFGFLAHTQKNACLPLIRQLMGAKPVNVPKLLVVEGPREMMMRVLGVDVALCRKCGKGRMVVVERLPPGRGRMNSS